MVGMNEQREGERERERERVIAELQHAWLKGQPGFGI